MNIQYWNIIQKYNTIINLTQHRNDISCLDQKIFSIFFFKNRLFQDLNQQSHSSKSQITTDRPGSRPGSSFRAFGPEERCEVGAGCTSELQNLIKSIRYFCHFFASELQNFIKVTKFSKIDHTFLPFLRERVTKFCFYYFYF